MNILQLAEIETLRNSARRAIAAGLEDAEFYYSRADKATTEEERNKADAAGDRRRENAEWVSAYINKLEGAVSELQFDMSEAHQRGYDAAHIQMIKATQTKNKDAEIAAIRAYNDKKFGHSTEGQWRNGQYIGNDKNYRKTQQ